MFSLTANNDENFTLNYVVKVEARPTVPKVSWLRLSGPASAFVTAKCRL